MYERKNLLGVGKCRVDAPLHALTLVMLFGCVSVYDQPGTPMGTDSGCKELPTVEQCQAVARTIGHECLRGCVMLRCTGVKLRCGEYAREFCERPIEEGKVGGYVLPGPQDCETPREEIHWCELPLPSFCRARVMVHELAHSCGWHHGGGYGVPGNDGKFECLES